MKFISIPEIRSFFSAPIAVEEKIEIWALDDVFDKSASSLLYFGYFIGGKARDVLNSLPEAEPNNHESELFIKTNLLDVVGHDIRLRRFSSQILEAIDRKISEFLGTARKLIVRGKYRAHLTNAARYLQMRGFSVSQRAKVLNLS
ncbi:hypothetical protein J7412_20730 [Shimia sp. R9_3]|nr:hypothetical protein [Shimia sp. R9_3]